MTQILGEAGVDWVTGPDRTTSDEKPGYLALRRDLHAAPERSRNNVLTDWSKLFWSQSPSGNSQVSDERRNIDVRGLFVCTVARDFH